MGLECEWRHARKRRAENFGILKKTSVESRLWASRVSSLLGSAQLVVKWGPVELFVDLGPVDGQ